MMRLPHAGAQLGGDSEAAKKMVMDAIKTHPQVLIGGCLFENPYYMEPEHFLGRAACVN